MNHHLTESMAYCHDKILFGITSALSGSILWIGAVFTDGEARWLYLTAAASIMMAGFLSLVFRRPTESIRLVIGRAGIAILGGIFGTRLLVHNFDLGEMAADGINLAGIATIACAITFFAGIRALNILAKRSNALIDRVLDAAIPPPKDKKKDDNESTP